MNWNHVPGQQTKKGGCPHIKKRKELASYQNQHLSDEKRPPLDRLNEKPEPFFESQASNTIRQEAIGRPVSISGPSFLTSLR
jgi:hypothetical protein